MTTYKASNNGNSTLAGNLTAASTSFTVATGQGTRYPTINDAGGTSDEWTKITFQKDDSTKEIVHVVRHDAGTDVFTIGVVGSNAANVAGRGQEGTTATTWAIGDVVSLRPTADLLEAGVNFGETIAGAAAKSALVDADKFGASDSEDSGSSIYVTWASIKAALFAAWGALTTAGTEKTTPVDADSLAICDSAASDATKKLTWENVKATLKTYFDGLYGRLAAVNVWSKGQRGAIVTLTDGATIAVDMSLGNNFRVVLGGNRTLGHPTNLVAGQSGIIDVHQDATGSRTLALAWSYSPPSGVAPTLSTAALTRDQWAYYVGSADTDTVTITEANPGVVTWADHGFVGGEKIRFTTDGALPTNLAANTTYYIKPVNASTFQVSATLGGAAINTSGAVQSGTHTAIVASITLSQLKAIA